MILPRPIGTNILVQRNTNTRKGLIEIPERYRTYVTSDALVLDKGKKVLPEIGLGDVILHNKMSEGHELWKSKEDSTVQIITQGSVFAVFNMGTIIPIGNVVMIERFTDNQKIGRFYLPDNSQTLIGKFVSLGIPFKPFRTKGLDKLNRGTVVKVTKWDQSHHEVDLNGRYYVIVNEKDLEYYVK